MTPSQIQFVASLPTWHSLALALTGSQIDAKYQIIPICRPKQFWSITFLSLDLDRVYNFVIDDVIDFAVVVNPFILYSYFQTNRSQLNFWPILYFWAVTLGRVYNSDLKIDELIVFALVANPYLAIFRLIGAKSIFDPVAVV